MDSITAPTVRPQNPAITAASSQRTKGLESQESAIETQSDNDTDDSLKVSNSTVNISDSAVKLSKSAPITNSNKPAPIENNAQAQQSLGQLLSSFNSNPSQALKTHSDITPALALKALAA